LPTSSRQAGPESSSATPFLPTTFPTLGSLPEALLPAALAQAIQAHNSFHGVNPSVLASFFRSDFDSDTPSEASRIAGLGGDCHPGRAEKQNRGEEQALEESGESEGGFKVLADAILPHLDHLPDWQREEVLESVRVELDEAGRYLTIPRHDGREAYRDMECFIETCRDEALVIRLARASAGGLDRFLSVLDHAPEEEYQRWEAFYRIGVAAAPDRAGNQKESKAEQRPRICARGVGVPPSGGKRPAKAGTPTHWPPAVRLFCFSSLLHFFRGFRGFRGSALLSLSGRARCRGSGGAGSW
jgi:hypothetical protein